MDLCGSWVPTIVCGGYRYRNDFFDEITFLSFKRLEGEED